MRGLGESGQATMEKMPAREAIRESVRTGRPVETGAV
jgi:hypothetical protein